jgi:hypothetical protein
MIFLSTFEKYSRVVMVSSIATLETSTLWGKHVHIE